MLITSAYFMCTVGLKHDNVQLLETITASTKTWTGPCILGADFNTTPQALIASGVEQAMREKVVSPAAPLGTCKTSKGNRTIDFFVMSEDLASGIDQVKVVHGTGLSPHSPVQISFQPNLTSLRARHLRKPQKLPAYRIIGPQLQVQGWEHLSGRLDRLSHDLTNGITTNEAALKESDNILHDIADLAEPVLASER